MQLECTGFLAASRIKLWWAYVGRFARTCHLCTLQVPPVTRSEWALQVDGALLGQPRARRPTRDTVPAPGTRRRRAVRRPAAADRPRRLQSHAAPLRVRRRVVFWLSAYVFVRKFSTSTDALRVLPAATSTASACASRATRRMFPLPTGQVRMLYLFTSGLPLAAQHVSEVMLQEESADLLALPNCKQRCSVLTCRCHIGGSRPRPLPAGARCGGCCSVAVWRRTCAAGEADTCLGRCVRLVHLGRLLPQGLCRR